MALINLTTIYTTQNWSVNNLNDTTTHTDYTPENVPAQQKFNLLPSTNQSAFFRRNEKNIGLDQVDSVSEKGDHLGLGNLKTGLKSLSFGSDQKGGGWSGQPFVTFDMDGDAQFRRGSIRNIAQGNLEIISTKDKQSFVDFPKRGGDYPSNDIDFKRIQAFLNTPSGTTFLDKQKALQFMNPRIETGTSMKVSSNTSTLPGLIENTRVYSSDNLLNQIKVQGTGGHVSRVGASNLAIQDDFYMNTVGLQNITNSSALNRLAILQKLKIAKTNSNAFTSIENFFGSVENTLIAKSLGISTNQTLLFNYPGGPTSGNGVGNTTIGRYVDTTIATTLNEIPTVMGYAQIANRNPIKNGPIIPNKIIDFRSETQGFKNAKSNWNFAKDSMETMLGFVKPGNASNLQKTDYTISISKDLLNASFPISFTNNDPYESSDMLNMIGVKKTDIIKFGFECMSNDLPGTSTALFFRAFLTNGFTDNNTANLNSFRYMGRGEEFFTYQGFTRQISFSFKIAAFSKAELKPLYNKLNTLISQVYPDYSPNTNVMRAPLVKITLGDYLYRVPGFIENVNVTVDNTSPWEVNLENDENIQQLPHVLDVSISFKPILSVLPKRQTENSNTSLITNNMRSQENPFIVNPNKLSIDRMTLRSTVPIVGTTYNPQPASIPPIPQEDIYMGGSNDALRRLQESQ